jgi:drug/metabolite transporter (DMT)-like permease
MTARHWLAMAVTLAGIVWVVLERQEAPTAAPRERHVARGLALAVTAALAQAVGMVLGRQGIGEYDAVAATFIRVLGALPGYFVLVTVLARWPSIFKAVADVRAMRLILLGSVMGPVCGVTCLMIALRHCSAGVVTTIVSTMPVLVLPFSVLIFGEKISRRATLGAIVAVVGVALMCWNGG